MFDFLKLNDIFQLQAEGLEKFHKSPDSRDDQGGVNKGKKHVSTCYFTLQNVHS